MIEKCEQISDEAVNTVIYRLNTASPDLVFSSGVDSNSYSRDEMIQQIEKCSEVGVDFVKMQLEFLKAQASGELMRVITS